MNLFGTTILSILSFFHIPVHLHMMPAKSIIGLPKVIEQAKKTSSVPVIFPKKIPADSQIKTYYASASLTNIPHGVNYMINIDRTKDCHGAHYCNIGSLYAETNANPQIHYDRNHHEITMSVKLHHNYKGYFTPSHAMGDFWPAILQWRNNGTLYTLSWNVNPPAKEKKALTEMANSIIAQEQKQHK